jgi:hypothetical protein
MARVCKIHYSRAPSSDIYIYIAHFYTQFIFGKAFEYTLFSYHLTSFLPGTGKHLTMEFYLLRIGMVGDQKLYHVVPEKKNQL